MFHFTRGKIHSILPFLAILTLSSNTFAGWQFEIAPYLWATSMNGKVGVGPAHLHVHQTFSDILKELDIGGMLYATAHYDHLGFYFNGVYASLSNSDKIDGISISGKNKFGIVGGGLSYIFLTREFCNEKKLSLEPYAGFRHTFNDTTVKVDTFKFKKNVEWTDPVIGMQFDYNFNQHWGSELAGDIGGTNTKTHYSYSAGAFINYKNDSWEHVKLYLGYRFLAQHFETGSDINFYDWNMKIFGPVAGVGFTF